MSDLEKQQKTKIQSFFSFVKLFVPPIWFLITVALILSIGLFWPLLLAIPIWLNEDRSDFPSNYCPGESRYIADEEYIKKSTEEFTNYRKFDGKNYSLINCCYIATNSRINNHRVVYVEWSFERNAEELRKDKLNNNPEKAYAAVTTFHTPCNKRIVDTSFSTSSEIIPIANYGSHLRFVKWSN